MIVVVMVAAGCSFSGSGNGGGEPNLDATPAPDVSGQQWSLPDYKARRMIVVNNRNRQALANFPVAVKFAAVPAMERTRLRFRGLSDTQDLDFEVERLGDDSLVWVRLGLAENFDTAFHMYYDYQGEEPIEDHANGQAVFSGFAAAFHFYQSFGAGDPVDNTGTGANLGSVVGLENRSTSSVLGEALVFESTANNAEYAETTAYEPRFAVEPMEILNYEMWFRTPDLNSSRTLIDNYRTFECDGLQAFLRENGQLRTYFGGGGTCDPLGPFVDSTSTNLEDDEWHHVAMVVNRTDNMLRVYIDGQFDVDVSIPATSTSQAVTRIGGSIDFVGPFLGAIDELRISTNHDPDWIAASYHSGVPDGSGVAMVTVEDEDVYAP